MKRDTYDFMMFGPWETEQTTDTQYKLILDGDVLKIAFQGSVSKMDWKQNFDFFAKAYRDMPHTWYAHRGILKKWKAVEDMILTEVRIHNPRLILVYGFSQGGAIAALCHESLRFNFPGVKTVAVTLGAPRVTWGILPKEVKERFDEVIQYVYRPDIVPKLPPLLFGYSHPGQVKKFGPLFKGFDFESYHMNGYKEVFE